MNVDPTVMAPLSSHHFPRVLAQHSLETKSDPLNWLKFEPMSCHRCQLAVLKHQYCHEMYGSGFMQKFGWYVNQTRLRLGVGKDLAYLSDQTPDELIEHIERVKDLTERERRERSRLIELVRCPRRDYIAPDEVTYWANVKKEEGELHRTLERKLRRESRKLLNCFENITREEFGFRKIGEAWVSESLLFKIVRRIVGDRHKIFRHVRPEWLDGLELDIYIPGKNLALEYQGQQHYHPIQAWGGEEALRELQERDERKRALCQQNDVSLIEVKYTEPLTEDRIRSKIRRHSN